MSSLVTLVRPHAPPRRASRRSLCARRSFPFDAPPSSSAREIWLKPEMLQRGGAFKFRGAYNFLAQLTPASARAA